MTNKSAPTQKQRNAAFGSTKKPAKRYPQMIGGTAEEIREWNNNVKTRQVMRNAARKAARKAA